MIEIDEERDDEQAEEVECLVCELPVSEGEAESTYCGTVHESCLDEHKRTCAICDEDGEHHGDEDDEGEDDE